MVRVQYQPVHFIIYLKIEETNVYRISNIAAKEIGIIKDFHVKLWHEFPKAPKLKEKKKWN